MEFSDFLTTFWVETEFVIFVNGPRMVAMEEKLAIKFSKFYHSMEWISLGPRPPFDLKSWRAWYVKIREHRRLIDTN